jgi:hypothetical protein
VVRRRWPRAAGKEGGWIDRAPLVRGWAVCHPTAALSDPREDTSVRHSAPLVSNAEMDETLDIVGVLVAQLDGTAPRTRELVEREVQAREALRACRSMDFAPKLRRALAAKVLDLAFDARVAVRDHTRASRRAAAR